MQDILDRLGLSGVQPGAFAGAAIETDGPVIDSINPKIGRAHV